MGGIVDDQSRDWRRGPPICSGPLINGAAGWGFFAGRAPLLNLRCSAPWYRFGLPSTCPRSHGVPGTIGLAHRAHTTRPASTWLRTRSRTVRGGSRTGGLRSGRSGPAGCDPVADGAIEPASLAFATRGGDVPVSAIDQCLVGTIAEQNDTTTTSGRDFPDSAGVRARRA